ncbi:MAG: glycosyltransferase [Desulfovibrionaceae bacterium]|nr:glycosyltransferase [Desulfovibrionaceae bacterium]
MAQPLQVAFVSQDLCFGGTQRQLVELASRLDRTRFAPSFWTLTGKTDLEPFAAEKNVPVVHLGTGREPHLSFLYTLLRELHRRKPDILVPGTAIPNIWCRLYGKLLGFYCGYPAVLGTVRGEDGPRVQHERYLWRLADHIMCNSTPLYALLQNKTGIPPEHLTFIGNGVDAQRFCPAPTPLAERQPLIINVGRLVPNKNQQCLIKAFALVVQQVPEARLRIVGEGALEAELRAQVQALPALHGKVEFAGGILDVRPHYAEARIFCLSSVKEGQPNVLLEAMCSGLPVVTTNAGGACTDIVTDGVTGLVAQQQDYAALARHLITLLQKPDLCSSMGAAGREHMLRHFDFTAMVNTHEAIFDRIQAQRRVPR